MTAEQPDGGLIDLARASADASGAYTNLVLTTVNDHVIRMSVMTKPFHWHLHPDSDETFLCIEGRLVVETTEQQVELAPGQMFTVRAGVAHVTRPAAERSVNLTVEAAGMTTERLGGTPAA